MRKGDERRAQIIKKAEELFYTRGYEQTSVQEILDRLNLSKGGFYHHFESKSQLLQAICGEEAARDGAKSRQAMAQHASSPVDQLNALFDICQLIRSDRMDFAALMILAAYRGESWQLLSAHREAVKAAALPYMNRIIADGIRENTFFTRFPNDIGELILRLFANICDDIAFALAKENTASEMGTLLGKVEVYRSSVESLIGAPFGSIALLELKLLPAAAQAIRTREMSFLKQAYTVKGGFDDE